MPTAADNAIIANNGTYTVTVPANSPATASTLAVGGVSGTQTLAIDKTTLTLGLSKAVLSVTADPITKTYGAVDPALTFVVVGLKFSDTPASVLTGLPTRVGGETVAGGPYTITQGTLTPNGNYTISFTGNTLTITKAAPSVTADAKTKT